MSKYKYDEFTSRIRLSQGMFFSLKDRMKEFLEYVPLSHAHLDIYSLKLVTIILETGPEIINSFDLIVFSPRLRFNMHARHIEIELEKIRNNLLEKEQSLRKKKKSLTFKHYYDFLNKSISLSTRIVEIKELRAYTLLFKEVNPEWWEVYNQLRHDKYNNLKKATLANALKSLGALFWLNYYSVDWLPEAPDMGTRLHSDLFRDVYELGAIHDQLTEF